MNCICCKNWGKCLCHTGGDMINIYCSDIDSLGCVDEGGKPPFVPTCGEEEPTFITPAQYKDRTGREYPANAAVYRLTHTFTSGWKWMPWAHCECAAEDGTPAQNYGPCVCAFGDLVPPDDWRPE